MNDSLELIKSEIYDAKSNLQKFNKLSQAEPEKYSFWLTYFTNRLNILEHIKAELEAWEAVKELLIKGESISVSTLFKYHREVYNKINKAYEVYK